MSDYGTVKIFIPVYLLLSSGSMIVQGQALPESEVERLERLIFAAPIGHYYNLHHLRTHLGGAEALTLRWEKKFKQASGADRERWALLLAMSASPNHREVDLDRAETWLKQAGTGYETSSYRAVVASLRKDPESVIRQLGAAAKIAPDPKTMIQVFDQQAEANVRVNGKKHTPVAPHANCRHESETRSRCHRRFSDLGLRLRILRRDRCLEGHGRLDDC